MKLWVNDETLHKNTISKVEEWSRSWPRCRAGHDEAAVKAAAHRDDEDDETAMKDAVAVPAPLPSQPTIRELEAHTHFVRYCLNTSAQVTTRTKTRQAFLERTIRCKECCFFFCG